MLTAAQIAVIELTSKSNHTMILLKDRAALVALLRETFEYVKALEAQVAVNVVTRGWSFPEVEPSLGERIKAVLE